MEISESSLSVIYLSRALALAPVSVKTNEEGVLTIKRSKVLTIYSIILCLTLVTLVGTGFKDYSKVKFCVNSSTLQVVTALDVSMVALTCIAGISCGLCSVKPTQQLNMRLRKLDETLHFFVNFENDRFISRILAISTSIMFGAIISFDYYVWMLIGSQHFLAATFNWYIPFYGIYLVLIGSHILYANNALGLGRRFRRLNKILKYHFLLDEKRLRKTWVNNLSSDEEHLSHHEFDRLRNQHSKPRVELLKLLADNYESLYKCVEIFSNAFGFAALCNLISCMLHIVITGHFMAIGIRQSSITLQTYSQMMWIMMHIFRLLLVVEACHKATVESKKTIQIVSEIKRKTVEQSLAAEFQKFWKYLHTYEVRFSVLGICDINRTILTTFSSGIVTYLFIVLQFENTLYL
ncbi:gustatory receptor for sugar taste 43a isoform X1 [Bactrocera oleae]|uniref:gustatory receptor for sugar taste 43a isoform X1 n=1 Tax=Bactrocera oleae TaxID=104688 RepID=UPI00387EBD33